MPAIVHCTVRKASWIVNTGFATKRDARSTGSKDLAFLDWDALIGLFGS
jgi:hypothetical protein